MESWGGAPALFDPRDGSSNNLVRGARDVNIPRCQSYSLLHVPLV